MSTANPYQVPRSNVDHIGSGGHEYSEVKVLSIKGRLGRLRYLGYSIGYTLLIYLVFGILGAISAGLGLPKPVLLGVLGVAYVLVIVLGIMLTIQRAHDFNTTGWITLLAFVPLLNLMFLFIPGTDGENRFGKKTPPNPRGMIWLIVIPLIVIIGIVAAIAIPAYQAYVNKAQAAAGGQVFAPATQPE